MTRIRFTAERTTLSANEYTQHIHPLLGVSDEQTPRLQDRPIDSRCDLFKLRRSPRARCRRTFRAAPPARFRNAHRRGVQQASPQPTCAADSISGVVASGRAGQGRHAGDFHHATVYVRYRPIVLKNSTLVLVRNDRAVTRLFKTVAKARPLLSWPVDVTENST